MTKPVYTGGVPKEKSMKRKKTEGNGERKISNPSKLPNHRVASYV